MMYRKLKRVWSHNNMNYIPKFRETFPELNKASREELADRFAKLGIDWYSETKVPVSIWIRLTLPFALILWALMFIGLPFAFLIRGEWDYGFADSKVLNWFKSLKLL